MELPQEAIRMTTNNDQPAIKKNKARIYLLLIALVFIGPLVIATFMYYWGAFNPSGRTNHGVLLEPIVNIGDQLPDAEILAIGDGHWVLLYENSAECGPDCLDALYTIRQSRRMLGREMERVVRVFLHGQSQPDTVFLAQEHAGLVSLRDAGLKSLLSEKLPAAAQRGGYFLLDPLGNLVMYFEPDINPSDMVEDVKRLLKLSRIG